MTGGVDTLHIRFGEGVRRVEFSFKKITLTDIGDVHPARVDLSEPAQSTTPDQGDETTPPSSSPRRTTHEQGDKTTPPSSSPRRTTHDHAETSRVSWTSSSTSVVDGTSVHESSTGEITLTPTAVLIISNNIRDSHRLVYLSFLSLLSIPIAVVLVLLFKYYKRTHRPTRSASIQLETICKSTTV
ncbi:uncharacterized protein LOC128155886 isoform X2 [Crassostrea angulata]|nr:uncharacterized protein LOC128155886 isoform X2 [Crassostrea angulata]